MERRRHKKQSNNQWRLLLHTHQIDSTPTQHQQTTPHNFSPRHFPGESKSVQRKLQTLPTNFPGNIINHPQNLRKHTTKHHHTTFPPAFPPVAKSGQTESCMPFLSPNCELQFVANRCSFSGFGHISLQG